MRVSVRVRVWFRGRARVRGAAAASRRRRALRPRKGRQIDCLTRMVPKPPYSLDSSTWLSEVGEPFLAPLLGCVAVGDSIVQHMLIIEAGSSKGRQEQSEEGHRERVSFSARGSGPGRCHEGSATRCARKRQQPGSCDRDPVAGERDGNSERTFSCMECAQSFPRNPHAPVSDRESASGPCTST